jgi:Tol biopolymer transport system component
MRKQLAVAITVLAVATGAALLAQGTQNVDVQFKAAQQKEEVQGDLKGAIEDYKKIVASGNRALAVQALIRMAGCYQKLGDAEARTIYERIVREFPDRQDEVVQARAHLASLSGGSPATTGVVTRKVWTLSKGGDIEGRPSNDGRYIAYTDWDNKGDLYLHDLVSGVDRRLTSTANSFPGVPRPEDQYAEETAFARDGKRLAYAWFQGDEGRYDLRVVDLSGGTGVPQFRKLLDNADVDWIGPTDWSPDGKWIAVRVTRKDRSAQIGLVSADDGSFRVLKSVDWQGVGGLLFSPDGRYLAFDAPTSAPSRQHDIFLLATDLSRESPVVVHPANDRLIGWSPDGTRLVFTSDRGGSERIWCVPVVDGKPSGEPEALNGGNGRSFVSGMTSSGSMYFVPRRQPGDLPRLQVGSFDFERGRAVSPLVDIVQDYSESNSNPRWSPDGKYLGYLSNRPTGPASVSTLHIRSLETGEVRDLRPKLAYLNDFNWAPDGRAVAAVARDLKGRFGIHRIDTMTEETTPIKIIEHGNILLGADHSSFSPDGRQLYYRRISQTQDVAFVKLDVMSGDETVLLERPGIKVPQGRPQATTNGFVLSPDGRFIATADFDPVGKTRTLIVIPTDGGEPRELIRYGEEPIALFMWMADSRSLHVIRALAGAKKPAEYWRVALDGTEPRKLDWTLDIEALRGPQGGFFVTAVHPDRTRIAHEVDPPTEMPKPDELWVLEHFLPEPSAKNGK